MSQNSTLDTLNIKGNMIGDDGMLLISECLKDAIMLQHLDISLNEIGPAGF